MYIFFRIDRMSNETRTIKCVIIGDVGCGKKTMLFSYISKKPELSDHPNVYKPPIKSLKIGKNRVNLFLCDTKGHKRYDHLRPLCYPNTDVFIICFSLIDATSLDNVRTKWFPEIEHYCKNNVPVLLVGTKFDLREKKNVISKRKPFHKLSENIVQNDLNLESVSYQDGMNLAETIGAEKYIECSALRNKSIDIVFEAAAKTFLSKLPSYAEKQNDVCCFF